MHAAFKNDAKRVDVTASQLIDFELMEKVQEQDSEGDDDEPVDLNMSQRSHLKH